MKEKRHLLAKFILFFFVILLIVYAVCFVISVFRVNEVKCFFHEEKSPYSVMFTTGEFYLIKKSTDEKCVEMTDFIKNSSFYPIEADEAKALMTDRTKGGKLQYYKITETDCTASGFYPALAFLFTESGDDDEVYICILNKNTGDDNKFLTSAVVYRVENADGTDPFSIGKWIDSPLNYTRMKMLGCASHAFAMLIVSLKYVFPAAVIVFIILSLIMSSKVNSDNEPDVPESVDNPEDYL